MLNLVSHQSDLVIDEESGNTLVRAFSEMSQITSLNLTGIARWWLKCLYLSALLGRLFLGIIQNN
jgi:hypothetical protein